MKLTNEQIKELWVQYRAGLPRYLCFARAIEAALTEKQEPFSCYCTKAQTPIIKAKQEPTQARFDDPYLQLKMQHAEQVIHGLYTNPAPVNQQLLSALNAMLTYFGMDEDEWSKPTFDQARAAIAAAEKEKK